MASEQTIAELAYFLWRARGEPIGSPDLDWLEAERQVTGKASDESTSTHSSESERSSQG